MMNLSPTEMDRLVIFNAAQMARRNRSLGIKLSHPEAVAYITDEVMTAARRNLPYAEIRDMAGRLLTTDDVEPGVAQMIPMLYVELMFAEGTKVMALFEPIQPAEGAVSDAIVPGEVIEGSGDIEMFTALPAVTIDVVNTGDRDIQVRSHTHFFEVNRPRRGLGHEDRSPRGSRRPLRAGRLQVGAPRADHRRPDRARPGRARERPARCGRRARRRAETRAVARLSGSLRSWPR